MAQSITPSSSTYSQSNSSQYDPSSPPRFASMPPSDSVNGNTMYQTNPTSNHSGRSPVDGIESSMNGAHTSAYRSSAVFSPTYSNSAGPFSSSAGPSQSGFNPLGPSPNPSSQQQQTQQQQLQSQPRPYRPDISASASFPSQFPGSQPNYPTKADVFGTSQSLDALSRYEYDSFSDPTANSAQHHAHTQPQLGVKQSSYNSTFGLPAPATTSGSALLQSQQVQVSKLGQSQVQSPQGFVNNTLNGTAPYLNGVGQSHGQGPPPHHPVMQSSANGIGYGGSTHGHGVGQHPMHHAPGPGPGTGPGPGPSQVVSMQQGLTQQAQQQQSGRGDQPQEEISTIFVVGFPEDMHEREFQNMFTFSVGFEAATLKIPNKDSSAYGPAAGASGAANALRQAGFLPTSYPNNAHPQAGNAPYSAAQDPYNLVTVNSGGVVVDGPQGTSSSWQQSGSEQYNGDSSHGGGAAMPPRKQIIGFAKFRSRQEALDARDVLQGRRVDIEKGAILKAEMAKKNLHTKRGVGPLGLPLGLMGVGGSVVGPEMLASVPGMNGYAPANAAAPLSATSQMQGSDQLSARDRELSVLGAMGLGSSTRRDEDKERQQRPREEEERRRKEKELERERNNKLRMSNTTVYDAFHSVPAGTRANANGTGSSSQATLTPAGGYGDSNSTFPGFGFQSNGTGNGFQLNSNSNSAFGQGQFQGHSFSGQDVFGPSSTNNVTSSGFSAWSLPNKPAENSNTFQKSASVLPPRPPSSLQSSPPSNYDTPFLPTSTSTRPFYGSDSSAFSPTEFSAPIPPIGPRPRAQSPVFEGQQYSAPNNTQQSGSSLPHSSSSSVAGSQSSLEGEFRTLTVSTHQGMTSPQLPSPGSGGSSNNARQGNASDQNPPINTLYVGNLPNSPVPTGYPPNYLEESLRGLFSRCPGYRKLCFRQKSNGPMCFVEFEDVSYATKALNELYGNQLNGFVKGGIRLSFSKNPLGVRPTPSTANNQHGGRRDTAREWNAHTQQQQQQQQPGMNFSSIHDAFPHQQHQLEVGSGRQMRYESSELGSPAPGYHYSVSPPPPSSRFFSPAQTQSSFGLMGTSSPPSAFPRSPNPGAFNQSVPGFGSTQHSPPFMQDGEERLRLRDSPPHAFAPSPGLETTTRVG